MVIPPIDEVQSVLADFEVRLRSILESAWSEWLTFPSRGSLSPRSRASIVFDFIKHRALEEFLGDPNIRPLPKGQTIHFLFGDRVLLRFKKANSSGLGSNIETQAVLEFIDPQFQLLDLPEIYRVEACYHLDKLATKVDLVTISARRRNRRLWSYEMRRPPSDVVVPLPTAPQSPDDGKPAEVRPRKVTEKPETLGE